MTKKTRTIYDDTNWQMRDYPGNHWVYGKPLLECGGNGRVSWVNTIPGVSDSHIVNYAARLDAGVQTSWNDYAKVVIPVNEMPFAVLDTVRIEAYYTATTGIDMGVCIYLHDPSDLDQRIEISHTPLTTSAAGWRELNYPSGVLDPSSFFWYGDESVITEVLTEGTGYTFAQFQADSVFGDWTIYKITLDYGYYTGGGTMDGCYLTHCFINDILIPFNPNPVSRKKTVRTTKTAVGSACIADDVVSENGSTGTDWDFSFGGTGYITKAVIASATNAITPRAELQLYSAPPTCTLNDNAACNGPVAADIPYFVGTISFPAMSDSGTGHSFAVASPSTTGNLPLMFDAPILYGVLISKDAATWGAALVSILLSADMED